MRILSQFKVPFQMSVRAIQGALDFIARYSGIQYSFQRSSSRIEMLEFFSLFRPYKNGVELIRVGGSKDGGYLLPDDMTGITECFSPGVGSTWEFETELADRFEISSLMIDDSITPPNSLNSRLHFQTLRLGINDERGRTITLDGWVSEVGASNSQDFLLQMDIESHEWLSLLTTSQSVLERFRIMVVEFHSLPLSRVPYVLERIYAPTMRKLLINFDVVHVHPNNSVGTFLHCGRAYPDTLEVTFHRKNRATISPTPTSSAHPLDRPCDPDLPELSIDHLFLM